MLKNSAYPKFDVVNLRPKKKEYVIFVFVINEGNKVQRQLQRMEKYASTVDIVVADGGSTDGSLEKNFLKSVSVRALLIKVGPGKLSAQMRMAFWWALQQGYKGVIVIDGNNKDDVSTIPKFVASLKQGYDHIQGSRYIPGGKAVNTPKLRHIGLKMLHAPLISLASGKKQTDTTNGFRAYSRKLLLNKRIAVFRNIFQTYELHYHLAIEAGRLGFRMKEIPVTRRYPKNSKTPTKISPIKGNILILLVLFKAAAGFYRVLNENEKKERRFNTVSGLIAIFGFFGSILIFAPGLMSNDSITQFYQARNLVFFDWHPPIMSFIWGILMKFLGVASFLIMIQIILWASVRSISSTLYRESHNWLSIMFMGVPFLPFVISVSGMVWKDAMMAVFLLAVTALYIKYKTGSKFVNIAMLLLLTVAGLSRQNALLAATPVLFVILSDIMPSKKTLLYSILFAVFLFSVNNFSHVLPRIKETNPKGSVQVDDIVALNTFNSTEKVAEDYKLNSFLTRVETCSISKSQLSNLYVRCFTPKDREVIPIKYKDELNSLWLNSVLSDPAGYLEYRYRVFKNFLYPSDDVIYYWHGQLISETDNDNSYYWDSNAEYSDYQPVIENPKLANAIGEYVKKSFNIASFLFKPITYMILSILLAFSTIKRTRHRREVLMLSSSSLLYIAGFLLSAVSNDYRYVFWNALAVLVMTALVLMPNKTANKDGI